MDYSLQNKINRRLNQLKRDGVKFISCTIAPADSSEEEGNIESIAEALMYFESKDETLNLSVQLKWMGSRGTMYLFRESLESSFVVTRGGFKIGYGSDRLDNSKKFFKHWHDKIFKTVIFDGINEVILDGEIMPWNAIGDGLIQRQFVGYSNAVHSELDFLIENGFSSELASVQKTKAETYDKLNETDKKKDKFRETYDLLDSTFAEYDIDTQTSTIDLFDKQLSNYNIDEKPYFVAFDILRIKDVDGTVMVNSGWMASVVTKYNLLKAMWPAEAKKAVKKLMQHLQNNKFINDENILLSDIFDIGVPINSDDTLDQLRFLLDAVQSHGFEGFMLKPEYPMDTDAVHCMKVRNPEYLRLIYGHDYTLDENLRDLIKTKKTSRKRKISHQEYQLGIKMLSLDESSETYVADFERVAKQILFNIEEESTVDSRL